MQALGRRTWVIAEGYIPDSSTGPEPEMTSHETVCRECQISCVSEIRGSNI